MRHNEHGHRGRKLAMAIGGPGFRGEGLGGYGRHGHHRAGGRRARLFAPGELRLVLLHLIGETPRHGYELIRAIEELTGGAYAPSPGRVYPTLSLLADEGVIAEAADDGSRKAYRLTAAGTAELEAHAEEAAVLLARLQRMGEADARRNAPPVARAVDNLMTALRNRALAEEFATETVHQIADILDDAARRIERL